MLQFSDSIIFKLWRNLGGIFAFTGLNAIVIDHPLLLVLVVLVHAYLIWCGLCIVECTLLCRYKRLLSLYLPSSPKVCLLLLFRSPFASCSRQSFCTICSTISSMSNDAMECPKCQSVFYGQRSSSQHVRHCTVSLPNRASVYKRLPPILQHEAVDFINNIS